MHSSGHVGLGFLASIPLGIVAIERGEPSLAVAVAATVVVLSTLPDVDEHLPGVGHRTWTHSIPFVGVAGVGAGLVWGAGGMAIGLGDVGFLAILGGGAGALAVISHLLGDVVTPMGVALFWPISSRRRSLNLVLSKNAVANYLLLVAGVVGWVTLVGSDPGLVPAALR